MDAEGLRNAIVETGMVMDEAAMNIHNCDKHADQRACARVSSDADNFLRSREKLYEVLSKCQK